jgi:valyl-tRNA synthetase
VEKFCSINLSSIHQGVSTATAESTVSCSARPDVVIFITRSPREPVTQAHKASDWALETAKIKKKIQKTQSALAALQGQVNKGDYSTKVTAETREKDAEKLAKLKVELGELQELAVKFEQK